MNTLNTGDKLSHTTTTPPKTSGLEKKTPTGANGGPNEATRTSATSAHEYTPKTPESKLEAALTYTGAGLSVLPCDQVEKMPVVDLLPQYEDKEHSWKPLQTEIADRDDLKKWFGQRNSSIGIIGGKVSGNLEIIDFDAPELYPEWEELVNALEPGLVDRLPKVQTQHKGYHIYYRCSKPRFRTLTIE